MLSLASVSHEREGTSATPPAAAYDVAPAREPAFDATSPPAATHRPAAPTVAPSPGPAPSLEPAPAAAATPATPVAAPTSVATPRRAAPRPSPTPAPAAAPAPADAGDDARAVLEQTGLLRRARAALRDGDATAALASLAELARRFPGGLLDEEAAVLRIEALCAADRGDEARRARDGFLAAHAGSPLSARARRLCPARGDAESP
ncbi:MAG: hypothetical protein U0168_07535 [Nannocystaceae bacterium]